MLTFILCGVLSILLWKVGGEKLKEIYAYIAGWAVAILSMAGNPSAIIPSIAAKSGRMFTMKLGGKTWILLNDYAALKEIFVTHGKYTSGRPPIDVYQNLMIGGGMLFNNDAKNIKSITKHILRNQSGDMVQHVTEEVECLLRALKKRNGETFCTKDYIMGMAFNATSRFVTNERFDYDDPTLKDWTTKIISILNDPKDIPYISALMFFYPLRHLPVFKGVAEKLASNVKLIQDDCRTWLQKRMKELEADPSTKRSCMVDSLIPLILEKENTLVTEDEAISVLFDMFIAGTDTTAVAVQWSLLYLAKNQNFQEELFDGISRENACHSNKEQTPLLCSFIDEVLRHRTIVPSGGVHKVTETFKTKDKLFNKDTILVANLFAINRDPTYFEKPKEFIPNRFVDGITGKYNKSKHVVTFGVGRRMCLGAHIADMEVYNTVSGIVKMFKLKEDPKFALPDFGVGVFGPTLNPPNFKIKFELR